MDDRFTLSRHLGGPGTHLRAESKGNALRDPPLRWLHSVARMTSPRWLGISSKASLARLPHGYHRRTLPKAKMPRSRGSYEAVFCMGKDEVHDRDLDLYITLYDLLEKLYKSLLLHHCFGLK